MRYSEAKFVVVFCAFWTERFFLYRQRLIWQQMVSKGTLHWPPSLYLQAWRRSVSWCTCVLLVVPCFSWFFVSHTVSPNYTSLFIIQWLSEKLATSIILVHKIPRKFGIEMLHICPLHPKTVAALPCNVWKIIFQQCSTAVLLK